MRRYCNKTALAEKPLGLIPLSSTGGIHILNVTSGGEKLITAFNFGNGISKVTTNKLYLNNRRQSFFIKKGKRYYVSDIIKV